MCHHLAAAATNNEKTYRYDPPNIEQIIVDGDIAIVRLIWTLRVTSVGGSNTEITKEKGLDVFRRQSDGSWKIAISYAYPL
jgi:ketosteroid isomerase-like protein